MSDDRPTTYAENKARRDRELANVLDASGVTRYEHALFVVVYYGIHLPPEDLPDYVPGEAELPGGVAEVPRVRVALTDCIGKGWLRVIDQAALDDIAADLRAGGFRGPVNRLPPVGTVDFTPAGAGIWQAVDARRYPGNARTPFASGEIVCEKGARYFRTLTAAEAEADEWRVVEGVTVSGPVPTGPWRARWWQRFPEGYRVDIAARPRVHFASPNSGEECYHHLSDERADPRQMPGVLDRHNITPGEWAALAEVSEGSCPFDDHFFKYHAANSARHHRATVTLDEFRDGLANCLRYGWLRVLDHAALDEVRKLLRDDSVHLAVPRMANLLKVECTYAQDPPRQYGFIPAPWPEDARVGEIDFTPAGAALFRGIADDWLGPDREDDLQVSNGYYREEHRYCETEAGFRGIVEKYRAEGQDVRSVTVEPIGPWCVYWWQRYASGYRMTLHVGEP